MFNKNTKKNLLRAPLILYDLQTSETAEKEISALTVLNEVISSNQEEIDLLRKVKGFRIIMKCMRHDERIINLCLKILVTASKKDEKVRNYLMEDDIFGLLAIQLQYEYNFSKNNMILYTALIVILVQGNQEAQYRMRKSGCLSNLVFILNYILDHAETDGIPRKNTEMIIYAITSALKNPRHAGNQVEIGWVVPKIVSFIWNNDQNDMTKCFWSFLRNILDKNEINQEIFLKCSGLIVLFRSLQEIVDEGKCQEHEEQLSKIIGVLMKFKSHKEFLYRSSNYCSIMILSLILMKSNNPLVMRHVITFLSSLVREIPGTLNILKDSQIQIIMRKALTAYSEDTTENLVQDLWDALEASLSLQQGFPVVSGHLEQILNSGRTLECQSSETGSLYYPESGSCILHCLTASKELQVYSGSLLNCSQGIWMDVKPRGGEYDDSKSLGHLNMKRIKLAVAYMNFHRRELKKKIQENHSQRPRMADKSSSGVLKTATQRIYQVFQRVWSYLSTTRSSDVVEWNRPLVKSRQFLNNQLFEYY